MKALHPKRNRLRQHGLSVQTKVSLTCSRIGGFSLIEVLIALGVASIIGMITMQASLNNQKSIVNQEARVGFIFPKLMVQQIIRDNSNSICSELGLIQENPSMSVRVPTESEVATLDSPNPPQPSANETANFFNLISLPTTAKHLGVVANSSPKQFLPKMGFSRTDYKCVIGEGTIEKCYSKLLFVATASSTQYSGLLPSADQFPIEFSLDKVTRKLVSCQITDASANDRVPSSEKNSALVFSASSPNIAHPSKAGYPEFKLDEINSNTLLKDAPPSTSLLTVPKDGNYDVSVSVSSCTGGANSYLGSYIFINGVAKRNATNFARECASATARGVFALSAGDKIKGHCAMNDGSASKCTFEVIRLP